MSCRNWEDQRTRSRTMNRLSVPLGDTLKLKRTFDMCILCQNNLWVWGIFMFLLKSNRKLLSHILGPYIDGLAQDCSNSSALALELLESCAKSLIWCFSFCPHRWWHYYVVAQITWNNLYMYLSMNKCHTRCEYVEVEGKYFLSSPNITMMS